MTSSIDERLSALMDGELARDETRFLLRRIGAEAELRCRWARWHVARDALQRQPMNLARAGLADAVMSELAASGPRGMKQVARVAVRWGAGGAIAASVALTALIFGRPEPLGTSVEVAEVARARPPRAVPAEVLAVAPRAVPREEFRAPMLMPAEPIEAELASFGTESGAPIVFDPRLQPYLLRPGRSAGVARAPSAAPYLLMIPTQPPPAAAELQSSKSVMQDR